MNYTKLFNSIITSTIWTEDDKTRIVWITMLALADKNGEVQASIPGLARVAGVSIADAEIAIGKFLSPDEYSRTPDDEGRRIEAIDGGWYLLNHAKYREMASREDSQEKNRDRQRRFREKDERNGNVTLRNASVTPCNADVTLCNADVTLCNADVTPRNATVTHTLHIAEADTEADTDKTKREREEEAPLARSRSALHRSEIISKINSIKPEWQKPAAWSAMELHDLHSALGQVSEMDDSDWSLLRRYMAARTQTGAGFWQPKSRGQFVANFGDVYGHAQRWASKDKPSIVRQPEQVQARDIIDRDSLKAIFG
jgi:hypothetical protein